MVIQIEERPTTEQIPATELNPSELLRMWPNGRWLPGSVRYIDPHGTEFHCAIGIVARYLGHRFDGANRDEIDRHAMACVANAYDTNFRQLREVISANDYFGQEAAARAFEGLGL